MIFAYCFMENYGIVSREGTETQGEKPCWMILSEISLALAGSFGFA
jgi:hypothetical protein